MFVCGFLSKLIELSRNPRTREMAYGQHTCSILVGKNMVTVQVLNKSLDHEQ